MGLQQSSHTPLKAPTLDTVEARFILDHVQNNCVTIFSKSYCIHCANTKRLFDEIDIPYKVIELNHIESGDKIQEVLGEMTNGKTVSRAHFSIHVFRDILYVIL